jgi:hypothetical protein
MPRRVQQDNPCRFTSRNGTPAPAPEPSRRIRRERKQFKHFRVYAVLCDADRADYEKLMAHPNTTVRDHRRNPISEL